MYNISISGFTRSSIYIYDISSLRVNYSYKFGNVSCLQAVLPKFLADHPPDQVQWKWIEQYFPLTPLNFPNSLFGKCAKYLAKITQMKSYLEKHMFVHLTSKLTSGRNQPRVACVSWTVSPDINWAECEAKHSVQSSAQFKKPPWNTHRQHLPLYLHFVSQGAGITELYECPSPITFSISVLLKALGTVVSIVNKLWAWWSMVWFPVWARDSSLLKTKSVAHKASYSMAAAGFWTFNLLALKLRINGGKTLHPLLALFCCQLCKKPDP